MRKTFFKNAETPQKVILVISDLHLGAGAQYFDNPLEDFRYDQELEAFFEQASLLALRTSVEVVINGDFLDFLAVPFVNYFDDEFWSEDAACEKLKLILEAHKSVFAAMNKFLKQSAYAKIVYVIGNHDGEMVFEKVQELFHKHVSEDILGECVILASESYWPHERVLIQHGHLYEEAHRFEMKNSIIADNSGRRYFIPPWGSYYVTHVINRYKHQRSYINAVRPIKNFVVQGLIFDTFFMMRFLWANLLYFFTVRFWMIYSRGHTLTDVLRQIISEITLLKNFETPLEKFFKERNSNYKVMIVGHTHHPQYVQDFEQQRYFINTGTWTRMLNLDLANYYEHSYDPVKKNLHYARVHLVGSEPLEQEQGAKNTYKNSNVFAILCDFSITPVES